MCYNLLVSLQKIFESAETWITAGIALIGSTGIGAAITAVVSHAITKRIFRNNSDVKAAAELAAEKTADKIVGKSINVDVSAEVNAAIDKRFLPLEKDVSSIKNTVQNMEIGVASIANAQSKSRLLNVDEKGNLQNTAKKLLSHAQTSGNKIIETPIVKFEKTEVKEKSEAEETKPKKSLISFEKIEKTSRE